MSIRLGRLVISEPTLQKILDFLPYPFLVSELKDGLRTNSFINKKFSEEIGYTLDEIPTIHDWFSMAYPHEPYRITIADQWDSRMKEAELIGDDSVTLQARIHTKKGTDRWYEVKASTGPTTMVAFIDIDEVKSREENLKQLNANRDRILSILGHDLRGPIMHMYTLSKMALNDQISKEDFLKMIAEVNRKAFQSMEVLSTTLAWAKSNFDSITIRPEETDLMKLVEDVVNLYSENAESKNLTIKLECAPSTKVITDREILTTVLRNLISNAIKFSFERGVINIRVSLNDGRTVVEVIDSGMGMTSEKIQEILLNRYQSTMGTYGEKGLGIGLMLCLDLLNHIRAELQIESNTGKGTTMRISLLDLPN